MIIFVHSFWIFSKDRWPSNPATFTSGLNWIPEISRQPIIFRNCSISTFDRHMKLNTSAKFHDFFAPHYFQFSAIRFDAPTLLSFSGCTHAHANCPPLERPYSGEILDKMQSKENKTVPWLAQLREKGLVSGRSPVRTPAWPTLRVFKFQTEKKVLPF